MFSKERTKQSNLLATKFTKVAKNDLFKILTTASLSPLWTNVMWEIVDLVE